jgi:hypothetical protein
MGERTMTQRLKCVIFGDRYVIQDDNSLPEIKQLMTFLISRQIKPVVLSNDKNQKRYSLEKQLKQCYQELDWYIADRDKTPEKPKSESVLSVLKKLEIKSQEAIYVGNTDNDMKTAVNGNLLFLNASWYGKHTDYGFEFKTPREIARFIDIFCLREHLWAYEIKDNELEYYALGIYGRYEEEYDYTKDAIGAAKLGRGHPDFWIKYLLSTVYFSGLYKRIDYIAPYPGHKKDSTPTGMEETIVTFAKCFRKKYLKDLIIRHKTADKSAYARKDRRHLDHLNQLNTIQLNGNPLKDINSDDRYEISPIKEGKTVLIIDDFCTQGYSLEAARVYIEQTGAKAILLTLLKTINKNYERIEKIEKFNPFESNTFSLVNETRRYPFSKYIIESSACQEIRSKLREYNDWQW